MTLPVLQPFGPELWLTSGTEVAVAGFRYPTRMAVIRLRGAELFVWSPVALTAALRDELAALGRVAHLVAPNSFHYLFLAEWKAAYPAARLWGAPGLAARRTDLVIDAELGAQPPADWAADLDQVLVHGCRLTTEAVFFHRQSGVALFCDLIQQFEPDWFRGWRRIAARLDLMTEPEPAVPRKFRLAFTDRPAARTALRRILDWPCRAVVMAHGRPVEREGQAYLARAFGWLMR